MLPPPASLSWVLMYDLKPMSGAADGCLRSVKVGSVRNSSFAKGWLLGSFSINSRACKVKQAGAANTHVALPGPHASPFVEE